MCGARSRKVSAASAIGQKRDADVAAARAGRLGRAAQLFGQLGRRRASGGGHDRQSRRPAQRGQSRVRRRAAASIAAGASLVAQARDEARRRRRAQRGDARPCTRRVAGGQRLERAHGVDGRASARRSRTRPARRRGQVERLRSSARRRARRRVADDAAVDRGGDVGARAAPALRRAVRALGEREERARGSYSTSQPGRVEHGADRDRGDGGAGAEAQLAAVRRQRRCCRSRARPRAAARRRRSTQVARARRDGLGDQRRRGRPRRRRSARSTRRSTAATTARCRRRARAYSPIRNSLPGALTVADSPSPLIVASTTRAPGPGAAIRSSQTPGTARQRGGDGVGVGGARTAP